MDDFEHLSQFDPDDEFLQSERSFSIIESLVSGNQSMGVQSLKSGSSEFSIVSNAKSASMFSGQTQHSQIQVIKNEKDTYIEDIIT